MLDTEWSHSTRMHHLTSFLCICYRSVGHGSRARVLFLSAARAGPFAEGLLRDAEEEVVHTLCIQKRDEIAANVVFPPLSLSLPMIVFASLASLRRNVLTLSRSITTYLLMIDNNYYCPSSLFFYIYEHTSNRQPAIHTQ